MLDGLPFNTTPVSSFTSNEETRCNIIGIQQNTKTSEGEDDGLPGVLLATTDIRNRRTYIEIMPFGRKNSTPTLLTTLNRVMDVVHANVNSNQTVLAIIARELVVQPRGNNSMSDFDIVGSAEGLLVGSTLRSHKSMESGRAIDITTTTSFSAATTEECDSYCKYVLYVVPVVGSGKVMAPTLLRSHVGGAYFTGRFTKGKKGETLQTLVVFLRNRPEREHVGAMDREAGNVYAHHLSIHPTTGIKFTTPDAVINSTRILRGIRWHQWLPMQDRIVVMSLGDDRLRFRFELCSMNSEGKLGQLMRAGVNADWFGSYTYDKPKHEPPVPVEYPQEVVDQTPAIRVLSVRLDSGDFDNILCIQRWNKTQIDMVEKVASIQCTIYSMLTQRYASITIPNFPLHTDADGEVVLKSLQLDFVQVSGVIAVVLDGHFAHLVDVSHPQIGPFSLFTVRLNPVAPEKRMKLLFCEPDLGTFLCRPGTAYCVKVGIKKSDAVRWLENHLTSGSLGWHDKPNAEQHVSDGGEFQQGKELIMRGPRGEAASRAVHACFARFDEPETTREIAFADPVALFHRLRSKACYCLTPQLVASLLVATSYTHVRNSMRQCNSVYEGSRNSFLLLPILPFRLHVAPSRAELSVGPFRALEWLSKGNTEDSLFVVQDCGITDSLILKRRKLKVLEQDITVKFLPPETFAFCDEHDEPGTVKPLAPKDRMRAYLAHYNPSLPPEVANVLSETFAHGVDLHFKPILRQLTDRNPSVLRGLLAISDGLRAVGIDSSEVDALVGARSTPCLPATAFLECMRSRVISVPTVGSSSWGTVRYFESSNVMSIEEQTTRQFCMKDNATFGDYFAANVVTLTEGTAESKADRMMDIDPAPLAQLRGPHPKAYLMSPMLFSFQEDAKQQTASSVTPSPERSKLLRLMGKGSPSPKKKVSVQPPMSFRSKHSTAVEEKMKELTYPFRIDGTAF